MSMIQSTVRVREGGSEGLQKQKNAREIGVIRSKFPMKTKAFLMANGPKDTRKL